MAVWLAYVSGPVRIAGDVVLILGMVLLGVYMARHPRAASESDTLSSPDEVPPDEFVSRRQLRSE